MRLDGPGTVEMKEGERRGRGVARGRTFSWPGMRLHLTLRDLGGHEAGSRRGWGTNLQASQAVFCLRGGGRVFASSWIWFWTSWVGRTRPGRGERATGVGRGRRPGWEKECGGSPFCMIRERKAENMKVEKAGRTYNKLHNPGGN